MKKVILALSIFMVSISSSMSSETEESSDLSNKVEYWFLELAD